MSVLNGNRVNVYERPSLSGENKRLRQENERLKNLSEKNSILYRSRLQSVESVQSGDSEPVSFCNFPLDVFPSVIQQYITAQSAAKNVDPAFIAVPLIGVLGAAIGNSFSVEIQDEWRQISAVWCLSIANSGEGKSPGLDAVMPPVFQIDSDANAEFNRQLLEYQEKLREFKSLSPDKRADRAEPTKPIQTRYFTGNVTVEGLSFVHHNNPRGMLVYTDEAASWLKSMNKYNDGGDEHEWIKMMEGKPIRIDRKTGDTKTISINSPNVSLVGGIQPGTLKRALSANHFDSGLMARIILTMPPRRPRRLTRARIDQSLKEAYFGLISRLYNRPMLGPDEVDYIAFSDNAFAAFEEFFNQQTIIIDSVGVGPFRAFVNKLDRLAARLALILHFTHLEINNPSTHIPSYGGNISEDIMLKACKLASWIAYESYRIYELLDFSAACRTKDEELILSLPDTFTYKDVMKAKNVKTKSAAFKSIRKWQSQKLIRQVFHGNSGQSDGNYKRLIGLPVGNGSYAIKVLARDRLGHLDKMDTFDTLDTAN